MPELASPRLARWPLAIRELGIILLLAGCYFSSAQLGLQLVPHRGIIAAIWPPSGVALAAVLMLGMRVWPGITIGALASALLHGHTPIVALSLTAGGTAAAVMGAWMLRSLGFHAGIQRVREGMTVKPTDVPMPDAKPAAAERPQTSEK